MSTTTDSLDRPELQLSDTDREVLQNGRVCPFCARVNDAADDEAGEPCGRCRLADTSENRQATRARIGPWHVLQPNNPAVPGMKFDLLLSLVRRGKVTPQSVVRGPTTHQLWRFAAHVKGLSREFGQCYSCNATIDPSANLCPRCNRLQEPPMDPDVLLESRPDAGRRASGASTAVDKSPIVSRDLPVDAASEPTTSQPSAASDASARLESSRAALESASKQASRPAGGILTPAQLASAFQLNLPDDNAAAAARLQSVVRQSRSNRRRRAAGVALLFVAMLILSAGVLAWSQPTWARTAYRKAVDRFAPQPPATMTKLEATQATQAKSPVRIVVPAEDSAPRPLAQETPKPVTHSEPTPAPTHTEAAVSWDSVLNNP